MVPDEADDEDKDEEDEGDKKPTDATKTTDKPTGSINITVSMGAAVALLITSAF